MRSEGVFQPVSREGALVFNNLVLSVAAAVVFIGTLGPLFREFVDGEKISVGAPFYDLDQAQPGDEIHVTDRSGTRWVYEVVEQVVVHPSDNHVLGPDPLETGRPMLTLTTCNPRWSNAERLIVHAQLAEEHLPQESV